MSLFPLDESDLPRRETMVGVSLAFGACTVALSNLIFNLPFYHRKFGAAPPLGRMAAV